MARALRLGRGLILGLLAGCAAQCQHEEPSGVETSLLSTGDVKAAKTLIDSGAFQHPGKLTEGTRLAFTQIVASAPQEFLGLYCKLGQESCRGKVEALQPMVQAMGFHGPAAARREFNVLWGAVTGGLINQACQKVKDARARHERTLLTGGNQPVTAAEYRTAQTVRDDGLREGRILAQNAGELLRVYAVGGKLQQVDCNPEAEAFESVVTTLLGVELGAATGFGWKLPRAKAAETLPMGAARPDSSLVAAARAISRQRDEAKSGMALYRQVCDAAGSVDLTEDLYLGIYSLSKEHTLGMGISGIDVDPNTPGLQTSEETDESVWEAEIGRPFKEGTFVLLQR